MEQFVQKRILGRTGIKVMEISLDARTPEQISKGLKLPRFDRFLADYFSSWLRVIAVVQQ